MDLEESRLCRSDFLNDDVGFSPGDDRHGDQDEHQQQHNYDDMILLRLMAAVFGHLRRLLW